MDYSCIIFDTAPTGHTLRLLQFPTTLEKGLSKLASLKGAMGGMMSQVKVCSPPILHINDVLQNATCQSAVGIFKLYSYDLILFPTPLNAVPHLNCPAPLPPILSDTTPALVEMQACY